MVKEQTPTSATESEAKLEKRRSDAAFVLNNPVFLEVSEPIRKMRSNLLIVSVISLFKLWFGGISSTLVISGLQFNNLSDTKISQGLLVITGYMLVHFVWSSWDGFQEWWIRCSGVKIAFTSPTAPNTDPRQVSLMTWWTNQVAEVGRQQDSVKHAHALFEKAIEPLNADPTTRELQDRESRHEMIQSFQAYSSGMMQLYKMGVSLANEKSLREQLARFDLIYKRFLVSQNWRWIVIEFLTPTLIALGAIWALLTDLNLNPCFNFAII